MYYSGNNQEVAKYTNCPTTDAFTIGTSAVLGPKVDEENSSSYVYRLRKLTTYKGIIYIQYINSGSTAGSYIYGPWQKIIKDSDVDSSLSTSSTNPVQNKVVKNALDSHTHNSLKKTAVH